MLAEQIREKLTPARLREDAKFFALLNLGLFLTALGTALFKAPNHFAFGGTTGLSVILATLWPQWNVGGFMWLVNAVLVVLGFVFLGVRSMGWTIFSSFALSFYVSLCERLWPLEQPMTDDVFLELCFAVILPALGAAIVFNIGASTGGTDIIAMILHKYTSLEIGRALLVSDIGIVLWAAYLYGPATGLYCILGMILKSTVVDNAIESLNLRKVCTVVTSKPDCIRAFIVEELHRSATEERATGAFTHEEKWALMTVLTRQQAQMLRNFIRIHDPHAFITIVNSSEIIGKGFLSN
ncbi:YitT family protein [Gemmiger sp.]